jgi:hypothetical protein
VSFVPFPTARMTEMLHEPATLLGLASVKAALVAYVLIALVFALPDRRRVRAPRRRVWRAA